MHHESNLHVQECVLRLLSFLSLLRQSTVFDLDDEAPQIECNPDCFTYIVASCHIVISSLDGDEVLSHSGATIYRAIPKCSMG